MSWSLAAYLKHQRDWSEKTFGPGVRTRGICEHIRKELDEVEESGGAIDEWIDVMILALDGCWRTGVSADDIEAELRAKMRKNARRDWPDWRSASDDQPIEHVRGVED